MTHILEEGPIRKILRERIGKRSPEALKGCSLMIRLYEDSTIRDAYVSLPLSRESAEKLYRQIQSMLAHAE